MQGLVKFPGVQQAVSATVSVAHGISPSVFTLEIAPQRDFAAEGGTLELQFGSVKIAFPDCKVNRHAFQRTLAGEIWQLNIFDRRWKWSYGRISGLYNLRHDDGTIKEGTEKTPRELAELCLRAAGEEEFDTGDMPDDVRPEVQWDFHVPMEALANLCDLLGCRIVLQLDNKVAVRKAGEGSALPAGGVMDDSLTIDPPEKPDKIAVVCGPDWLQWDFLLEPVGEETDGTLVPVDELSYKPADGWSEIDLPFYLDIDSDEDWEKAKATVFRIYRIKLPVSIKFPGGRKITLSSLDQILPIDVLQNDTYIEDGERRNKPAIVYGKWYMGGDDVFCNSTSTVTPVQNDYDKQIYKRPFAIDTARGLVVFAEDVYANSEAGVASEKMVLEVATLRLRTRCHYRASLSSGWDRHARERVLDGRFDTQTKYIRHDELAIEYSPAFPTFFTDIATMDNEADVTAACDHYLDAAEREYQVTLPQSRRYVGLRNDVDLDGAIQQMVFQVGTGGGASTIVSRNDEKVRFTTAYRTRREREKLRAFFREPPPRIWKG